MLRQAMAAVLFAVVLTPLASHGQQMGEPIDLPTGDWAYTSTSGIALISKDSKDGDFALRFKNSVDQSDELVYSHGTYYKSLEIRASGWQHKYKGWAYTLEYTSKKRPKMIFLSNELGKNGSGGYPIAFLFNEDDGWVDSDTYFARSHPVGLMGKLSVKGKGGY